MENPIAVSQNITLIYSVSPDGKQSENLDKNAWKNNDTLYQQDGQYYFKMNDDRYEFERDFYTFKDDFSNPHECSLYEVLTVLGNVNQYDLTLSDEAKNILKKDLSEFAEKDIEIVHYNDNDLAYVLLSELDFKSLEISVAERNITSFSDKIVPFAVIDIDSKDPVFEETRHLHIHLPLSIHCGQAEFAGVVYDSDALSDFTHKLDLRMKENGKDGLLSEIQFALEQSDYEQEWMDVAYQMIDMEKEEKDTPNFVHCYIEKNENQTTEDLIEKAEKFAQQKADTLSVVMENEAKETGSPRYTYGDIQVWHYTLQSGQMTAVVDINTGEIQKNEEMHKALFRNSNKNSQKNDITLE